MHRIGEGLDKEDQMHLMHNYKDIKYDYTIFYL